jgi:hypothetical protein
MWMDGVILKTSVETDGGATNVRQELRISVDDGMVYVQCDGLFRFRMSYEEFDNFVNCVGKLQELARDYE